MSLDKDSILEEYRNIRSEILQLNSQAFTAVTLFLGADMTILGWMLSKNPSEYLFLPTVGVLILFGGCILLLVRNRLAHRLGIFQKHFIETRIPHIYWARAYFLYREKFAENTTFFEKYGERLAESNVYVLNTAQLVNMVVFLIYALSPLLTSDSVAIDWWKVLLFVVMVITLFFQLFVTKKLATYENIEKAMKEAAKLLCENPNKSVGN